MKSVLITGLRRHRDAMGPCWAAIPKLRPSDIVAPTTSVERIRARGPWRPAQSKLVDGVEGILHLVAATRQAGRSSTPPTCRMHKFARRRGAQGQGYFASSTMPRFYGHPHPVDVVVRPDSATASEASARRWASCTVRLRVLCIRTECRSPALDPGAPMVSPDDLVQLIRSASKPLTALRIATGATMARGWETRRPSVGKPPAGPRISVTWRSAQAKLPHDPLVDCSGRPLVSAERGDPERIRRTGHRLPRGGAQFSPIRAQHRAQFAPARPLFRHDNRHATIATTVCTRRGPSARAKAGYPGGGGPA